jgi:bifunctional non-homologous end joining protein LigD
VSARERSARGELGTYRGKRDFDRTSEPTGRKRRSRNNLLSFVVQKHAASHLHYDFRLEWDGVLLSWAVPKGPVPDPSVRRLAMRTEDHPMSYADFEGVIPAGSYGGGTVMVWDRGRWTPRGDPAKDLAKGKLDFDLEGEKLNGRWTLVRTGDGDGGKEAWLLFKRSDEAARRGSGDALLDERPLSVVTGRSLDEIAADRARVWRSGEAEGGPEARSPEAGVADASGVEGAREASISRVPDFQLTTLVDEAPKGDDWIHEMKYDGYRLRCTVVRKTADEGAEPRVRLTTRGGKDWTDRFPRIARALGALPVSAAVLDGEAVVMDAEGRSDFQALQQALGDPGGTELHFYAFDLLHLDGWDVTRAPLTERKRLLRETLEHAPSVVRYSDHVVGRGPAFHTEACQHGLEGIVSKRATAPYAAGRGRSWLKVKCLERQEMVVVGWTEPEGSRAGFGALVLGVHDAGGDLVYAGRVGTGFTAGTLRDIRKRLEPLARRTAPVKGAPKTARGRAIHWVRPELVAEVAFTEWTADGIARHPSFQGLREDKRWKEVVREREVATGGAPEEAPEETGAEGGGGAEADEATTTSASTPRTSSRKNVVKVAGVTISNPDRVLYPEAGVTKADVARYWAAVSDAALPLLVDRPLTLYRCPKGIGGTCFFQKHAPESLPEAVRRVHVPEKTGDPKPEPYMLLDGLAGLITLVQHGVVEFHVWGARSDRLDRPDTVVMDVDPGPGVPWSDIVLAAVALRDLLAELGLRSWPRATGGKGVHVVVPLVRRHGWSEVKAFARALAELMASAAPDRFVATSSKKAREGKIYVDYLRNDRNATAIGTFSPRARPGAPVAHPLSWTELEGLDEAARLTLPEAAEIDWTARDPWREYGGVRQSITRSVRSALRLG